MPPAKGSKPKREKKDPKKQMSEVAAQNEQLMKDLQKAQAEQIMTREKLNMAVVKLTDCMDHRWKKMHNVMAPDFDPSQLSADVIADMLDRVIVKHEEHQTSVAVRVEQLEKQVTQMSFDFLRISKKSYAYELGLNNLLICDDVNTIKDRIYQLQIIAGAAFHSCEANDITMSAEEVFAIDGITTQADCDAVRETNNANMFQLLPLLQKEPGETLINEMFQDLKLYLVNELSIEKSSGADWRALAQRVGLPQSTIDELTSLNLTDPAGHVLDAWTETCPTATVRLLHRHLASPAMRCTILCKRLCDFYDLI